MQTRTLYWILGAWIAICGLIALTGCRTKSVVEVRETHDTLRVLGRDTVTRIVTHWQTDTLRMETERTVTLSEKGDTVRVAVYRDRWRDRIVTRTDTLEKTHTDTIYRVAVAEKDKATVVKPTWWESWGVWIAIISAIALFWVASQYKK